eukprot:1600591-Amphidinium_carterae.2
MPSHAWSAPMVAKSSHPRCQNPARGQTRQNRPNRCLASSALHVRSRNSEQIARSHFLPSCAPSQLLGIRGSACLRGVQATGCGW